MREVGDIATVDYSRHTMITSGCAFGITGRTVRCSSFLVATLGLSLLVPTVYTAALNVTEDRAPRTCFSEESVRTASKILQYLNKDVDPCNHFYEFACGGWIKNNPIPAWKTTRNQFETLRELQWTRVRELLEEGDSADLPNSVRKAKVYYRACMDTEKLENNGIKSIEKILEKLNLQSRPPTEVSPNFSWVLSSGRAKRMLGLDVFFTVNVAEAITNNSLKIINIDQVPPGFTDRFLLNPEEFAHELEEYHKYIKSMISIVDPQTDAEKFADDIMRFSKSLAEIMTPVEARKNNTHVNYKVTLKRLIQSSITIPAQWKKLDWDQYMKLVFANTSVVLQPEKDLTFVIELPYLLKLDDFLSNTEGVLIEKYMWWRVFSKVAPLAVKAIRDLKFEFRRALLGQQQQTPRWKRCTLNANTHFGMALSYLYVKRHFKQTTKQKVIEMIEDVTQAFSTELERLDWLDSTTRLHALDKLKAMRKFVGYPTWLLTSAELDKHYEHIEVVEDNLLESYLNITWAEVKKSLETFREKPDRDRWSTTPTTVNAFYSPTLNSITIPAAILDLPFYGNGIEAINYGAIGAILGHEVTHGFDSMGSHYNDEGNLERWWSADALQHFKEKEQCFIDQYSKYQLKQLPNRTVSGFRTLNENIADNGGLRIALNAYSLFTKRNPVDRMETLPGLSEYNPEQLFFLGFAQTRCDNSTMAHLRRRLALDSHSPNKIRVIGTLRNSKEFAEAWKCPIGSRMNPEHKCVLWVLWCCSCMARWWAARANGAPSEWLSGRCTCPVCRATFCLLGVCPARATPS